MKRAAIYIRVSHEKQAEKVSPEEQEADCKALCESSGYMVVNVYRDIEQYRVGRRLVQPSATRSDRPALKRMLKDANAGLFDVLIAWRMDRLTRGVNQATVDLMTLVKGKKADIELVKETFDKKTAEILAWAAGVELEAKHDRFMMGMAGRLSRGKDLNNNTPYGYKNVDGKYEVNEIEAEWIQKIFKWFAEGLSGKTIRMQLITGNAPQRKIVKHPWSVQEIYHMLKKSCYYEGILTRNWDGKNYELPVPVLIDYATVQAVAERFSRYKKYPNGNTKVHSLIAGMIFCERCGQRMVIKRTLTKNGVLYLYYQCRNESQYAEKFEGCAGNVNLWKIDSEVWNRVWSFITMPGEFEKALRERIGQLQAEETDATAEVEKLERQMNDIKAERQRVITIFRKNFITEAELETQLMVLAQQENILRQELATKRLLTGNRAERLLELARVFREQVRTGADKINGIAGSLEQEQLQFEFRRRILGAFITRIEVCEDKSIMIMSDLSNISIPPTSRRSAQISQLNLDW